MRIFNTMTQQIEELTTPTETVKLYVCGVTPYDTAHLGHAFVYATFDTLVRTLCHQGKKVIYVENVTDIDDPLFKRAQELGTITWEELARQETDRFIEEMKMIGVATPDHFVRASDELPQMFAIIEKLLASNHAYNVDGWIYFAVTSDPTYAQLAQAAGLSGYENLLATANQHGNDPHDPRKRDPLDFVLWRLSDDGNPSWPSPWGDGRPGWHIECSAMATHYLGSQIDIHGGGTDLIFPHHSSEIAQSENATGARPFVRYWMHVGMVSLQGAKMSKSLGNLVVVNQLLRTNTPAAVRVLLMNHHYREPWEYTPQEMERAQSIADRLAVATKGASDDGELPTGGPLAQMVRTFDEAFNNDLDTPQAMAVLERLARAIIAETLSSAEVPLARSWLKRCAGLVGLDLHHA